MLFDNLMSTLQPYPPQESDKSNYQLNTPVSRCLQLLIDRHGEVVSQEEFFDYVWTQHGLVVSSNSFYQNISLLRKAIKKAGIDDLMIVTVPKKGIVLPKRFSVTSQEINAKPTTDEPELPQEKISASRETLLATLFGCLSVPFFILAFFLLQKSDYSIEYAKVDIKQDGCTFYFNKDETDYGSHLDFLKNKHFDCSLNKYIYIKTYKEIDRLSIFQCAKPMASNVEHNFCLSEVYP